MGMSRWIAAVLGLGLPWAAGAQTVDFELTPAETRRVESGELVIRADLDDSQRRGTVRAALRIAAPPAAVFDAMTQCADALDYVPHLRECHVNSQSADGRVRLVEHEVDFGWYAPSIRYVIRADLVEDRSIAFHQVSGDFNVNEGVWELAPDGAGTLLRYRVRIDPPGYVPNWLARSTFRKELPNMLAGLRKHCEAAQRARAQASVSPR